MNYDGYEALKIEKDGSILTITIDRPDVKNAVNPQIHDEFSRIFYDVDRDPEVSVVVLTGSGEAFSAGGDIDWLVSLDGDLAATSASRCQPGRMAHELAPPSVRYEGVWA